MIGVVDRLAGNTIQPNQNQITRAPPHLEANGKGPLRRQGEGLQWLAHLALLRFALAEKAFLLQLADDDRDCLRRQSREPRNFRLGQTAVGANQRQNQAFVIEADTRLRRSTHAALLAGCSVCLCVRRGHGR